MSDTQSNCSPLTERCPANNITARQPVAHCQHNVSPPADYCPVNTQAVAAPWPTPHSMMPCSTE